MVGLSHLIFSRTHPIVISVDKKRLHSGKALRDGYMAHQYHSRTSREIQSYKTCSLNLFQLVRNLANILGGVHEEVELAFEDELALEGHGAFLVMFDD